MRKNLDMMQQEEILDVFSDYLSNHTDVELIHTKNFGLCLLNITAWSTQTNTSYDVIRIDSVDSLCEILLDMIVQDYFVMRNQICLEKSEIYVLYKDYVQKYVLQLPSYQEILQEKFKKIIAAVICKKTIL